MDELKKARHKKLVKQLDAAGWKANKEELASNPVRFWLYSISVENGPRLVAQVGSDLHSCMTRKSGIIKMMLNANTAPSDLLQGFLTEYDESPSAADDPQMRGLLTVFLASYAVSTQTYKLTKPITEVPGAHFFIFDWYINRASGTKILRPICIYGNEPFSVEKIIDLQEYLVKLHVHNHPNDRPEGWP